MYFSVFTNLVLIAFKISFALSSTCDSQQFYLNIDKNPEYYVPKATYAIGIESNGLQTYSSFILTVESLGNSSTSGQGWFYLMANDEKAQFSPNNVNTIVEQSESPKQNIHVLWNAPSAGCVRFKAEINFEIETKPCTQKLERRICGLNEKSTTEIDEKECCACDEATYGMTFQGLWSQETHPEHFPESVQLTHFSDIIGCTHNSKLTVWAEGQFASESLRQVAEYGSGSFMESALLEKKKLLRSFIKVAGLWYPKINFNTTATTFRVDKKHNLLSLATMLGPSPDWYTGVSNINLCAKNCSWIENLVLDLPLYDAGTDSAISYMSPKTPTIPPERIHRITSTYPEDPRSPFYNINGDRMKPVARLFVRRERIVQKSCSEDVMADDEIEEDNDVKPECATTNYTDWSPCSVTCGKGLSARTRTYANPEAAKAAKCSRRLMSKKLCAMDISCPGESNEDNTVFLSDERCKTTNWTEWSECTANCGIGLMTRTRWFLKSSGIKTCKHVSVYEKKKCMQPACKTSIVEKESTNCTTTDWTDWSPCSVSCGVGIRIRIRHLTVFGDLYTYCANKIKLEERKQCVSTVSCTVDKTTAKEVCNLSKEVGPCRGLFQRWFFDAETKQCTEFEYGGCRGNRNNFYNLNECIKSCSKLA